MAIKFGFKKIKRSYGLQTVVTAVALCVVFLAMVGNLYNNAEEDAYENLHMQTKQIKDNITLQLLSDRENLQTMANFAAKLYKDGENYDLMFASFKPIGLIENIGILKPDNVFVIKAGSVDLNGLISFEEEARRGAYISGRVKDLTRENFELVRSAVPIVVDGETVGILYGVIHLEKLSERYGAMAQELDGQLFVYDAENGDLVIDTVHDTLGNISFLQDRKYNKNYSYEEMMTTVNGFTSFRSAYRDESTYLHYSPLEEIGWYIAMARYESQVFAQANELANTLVWVFSTMLIIIVAYIMVLLTKERQLGSLSEFASNIRKTLLETAGDHDHIQEALKLVCQFCKGRSAVLFNTDGEEHDYTDPLRPKMELTAQENQFLESELMRYSCQLQERNETMVSSRRIRCNKKLEKENKPLYDLLRKWGVDEISFSATINNVNHTVILAVMDAKRGELAGMLAEKVAACFSMALYNKNLYDQTCLDATTDALTGAMNRVAYKNDLVAIAQEKPLDFSCIYVDVNELHVRNNLYGHAAGDQMLVYIANTLKEVFFGHRVYRMGGDEFLVFCQNVSQETVKKNMMDLLERLETQDYHVSLGLSYRSQNTNTDEMVREAELRMYEEKALYYQNKEKTQPQSFMSSEFIRLKTNIPEIDALLSVVTEKYHGAYRVFLETDQVKRILMPKSFRYNERESGFSKLFAQYVTDDVAQEYRRAVVSFANYEALKQQLAQGQTPKLTYQKTNGAKMTLSVHRLGEVDDLITDTLWVFAFE